MAKSAALVGLWLLNPCWLLGGHAFLHRAREHALTPRWLQRQQQQQQQQQARRRLHMVRNIDLPECLVFYGMPNSFLGLPEEAEDSEGISSVVDDGLLSLLQECQDTDTAVIVIPDIQSEDAKTSRPSYEHLPNQALIHHHVPTSPPPNPRDLFEALNAITVQPRPFGGSSGFGTKQYADPERVPLASRTVVFCQTLAQTRAARFCGMRVLCFADNALADAIVDGPEVDFYLDDISTPGSFWLNPPNAQDDDGNKVDIYDVMDSFETQQEAEQQHEPPVNSATSNEDELSDEEIQKMLEDLSPL